MKITKILFITVSLSIYFLLGLIPRAISQDEAPAQGIVVCSACNVDENVYGTDENANTRIPPPPMLRLPPDVRTPYTEQPQFEVTYTGFTPEAEAAFQYAVEIWASILQSPVPIRIDAKLAVMEPGLLGGAEVDKLHSVNGIWFPDALADALAGFDKNPGQPDISITFNSDINWYLGTDGHTPNYRYDFVTIVLHEIGHGLGFISEAWIEIDASATWVGLLRAGDPAVPGVYDSFVVNSSGTSILTFEDPSVALLWQLIHNDLFWNGTNGVAASSGKRPKLYAPALWDEGSSYSHLSEATYPAGTLNSLMTSAASYAEAIHDPGPIALGMLADMGWTLNAAPVFRDGATTTRSIAENTLANQDVGKPVSATDAEDTTLIYALSGDPDAAAFDIDSTSGQLKTKAALDYETKNTYLITITAGDSRQRASTIYVTITVDNVNEAPAFASGTVPLDIPEGTAANTNIGSPVSATDLDDDDTLSYTLGGTDAASFTIDTNTGQLETEAALDYETTSTYTVTVTATDTGNLSDTVTVTITVTDVDEIATVNNAPIFTEGGSTMRAVAEHTPSGVAFDNPVFAIDPDGDTLSYILGGTDAAAFRIVSSSGQLRTNAPLDYETKDTYTVTITASDGSLADTVSVSINVIDVISPIRSRTPQVRDIIVAVVPGVSLEDDVTEADLAAITSLNLGDRRITALKAGDFDGLTALDKLYLNDNSLRELPDGIFSDLTALTHLTLKNNALSTLLAGVFSGLTSLTTLELQHNALNTLPSGIFSGLTSLTTLQLYSNALRTLPVGIFSGLTALDELKLSGNNLSSLPVGVFSGLTSLTTLYLHFNALSTLPAGIFSGLTDLESLALSSNNLSSLPAGVFSGLIALDELTLSKNNLSALPAGVFSGLTSLTKLYLYNNNLSALPSGIFSDLTSLFILSLSNNAVDPLPLTVSLEKVMEGQFKAVMPTGAPFEIVLPVSVGSNGSISGGASTLTIPKYHLESESLTVTRTPGTAAPVTVDIGALSSSLPAGHYSYNLVKSDDLPLEVISEAAGNMAPTFTEGETASREIAEDTASGVNIGAAVSATDPHNDHLTYTLGGTDAAAFRIVSSSGQLQTDAALDYETKNTYSVTVTVSDGSLTDTIAVIINVPYVSALISDRTPQVRDAILDAVPGVSSEDDITKAHLAAITSLDLRYRGITALKIGDFDGLTALTTLDLYSANFSTLPAGIFDDLTALTELDLSHTNLSSLPVGVFSGLTSLTTLKLNNNRAGPLRSLPAGIFSGLTSLTYLNLHSNWLSSLPSDIFSDLTSLTYLNLSYNGNLRSLPAFIFSGLTSLETLHLYGNLLSSLPDGIFSGLTSLTYLSLSQNVLRSLPDGIFSDLTAIETLKLNGNKLSSLPDGIFDDLTVLTDLGLSSNALSSLPEGIFDNLTALTSLRLFDNNLSSLPVGIFSGLTALTYLYLYGNTVDPLPLTVSLEKVGEGEFKAVAPTGAPFNLVLSISANNGTINGGATSITIPKGNVESGSLTVTRTPGTTAAVTVDIGDPLPGLPTETDTRGNPLHRGYALVKSDDLPLGIISAVGNSAPTFTETSPATRSVAENTASGINIGDPVSATDADNDTLTYTLLSGIDAASFRIVRSSGQLQTDAALDYETKNTYTVTVAVSDGNGGSDSITVTITGTDFISPIRDRTPEVRDAIVAAVPGVSSEDEVTEAHLAAITSLDLGWDGIKALKVGDFDGLTALEYLNLNNTALSTLPAGIFSGLTALTYLNLNNTALSTLPAGIFSDLTALTTLHLWGYRLSSLPEGIFDNLTALDKLHLGDAFGSLPEGIFDNLTALTYLNLDTLDLSTLPAGIFNNLTALTTLHLWGYRLSSLPEGIFDNLTALTYLNLSNNALSSLPEGVFSGLTSLESLWLQDNAVNPLPLPVSLEKVGEGEFKAVMPTGAPFEIVLPLTVMNGSIDGRATGMTIPKGGVESGSLTVTRPVGTTAPVTVNIGDPLPGLPTETNTQGNALHRSYALVKSDDLPLTVIDAVEADSPTVTIGVPSGTQTGAFDATITFSETVSGFTQSDLSLTGTANATITAWNTTDDITYTATITPTTSGDVTLGVAANVATNAANNPNAAATSQTVTVDVDSPTVTIGVPSGTQTGAYDATITFSETVSGFVQSDVSLTGSAASITTWSANSDNTVYTATITPTASGTVTISVAADVATDTAGNPNTEATSQTVVVDVDSPTVTIGVPSSTQTGAFDATITFSETVSGFVQSDAPLSGSAASITAWSTNSDNTVYTATITPTASGTVTVGVAADVATDTAGNPNTEATSQTVTIEIPQSIPDPATWMPDADLRSAIRSALGLATDATFIQSQLQQLTKLWASQSGISNITGLEYATNLTTLGLWGNSITNLEPIKDLTKLTDLRLSGNGLSDVSSLGGLTALTKLALQNNNIVDVAPLATLVNLTWLRLADNPTTDFSSLVTLVKVTDSDVNLPDPDTTAPGVSISVPSGVQNGAFDATITFTESVSDFVQADLGLSGAASVTGWNANNDNTVYTATITPTASGTVTVSVAANVATDAANNPNTAATSQTVTVDVDKPSVTINVPSGVQTGAFNVTITFTETVSGFTQSDVSLSGSVASITSWSANSNNTVYTATITPTASGTVTVSVAANVATDAAGNPNTAATSKTVTIDVDRPTVSIGVPSGVQTGAFNTTITFSEPVSGFVGSDISLSGSAASITDWSANSDNTVYTATITPTASGTVMVSVAANVATDAAGNSNTAATSQSVTVSVDTDPPGVSISVPSGVRTGVFDATITFTESVSGFTQSDLSLSGTATASITAWNTSNNTVYTATIMPTASGTVTLNVNAGVATDSAGNPNTAATSKAVTVDIDKPSVTIGVPSGVQTGAFDVTLTFTETVSGFVGSDISLSGSAASITTWHSNSSNTIYTATITPTASGTVTVSVAANVATDAAGNNNTAATSQTVTIEIPPAIPDPATWMPDANLRSAVRSALGLATDATFTQAQLGQLTELWASQSGIGNLTGLEYVTELTKLSLWANNISDLTPLQNLTKLTYLRLARNRINDVSPLSGLTALTSLGLQRNNIVDVAPLATLVNLTWLRLAGNSITDLSPLVTLVKVTDSDVDLPDPDTTAPGVNISVPSGVQTGAFNATLTFTETVSGFVGSDISLSGSAASITSWSANSNNTVYTATITPTASGTVTVSVAANIATDSAGNPNTAATSQMVTVDIDRPTATIGVPSGVQTGAYDVTITFTETVSGFVSSDVSLSGSTASITAWRANNSNTVYTATITPAASGTVTLNVSSGVATDAAGNPNTAATSRTVTVDIDRPTVTIGVPSGVQTGTFNTTITFSETVSGFTQSDVSLTGGAASITAWRANGSNTVYTATITPTASGTVMVSVTANVATDAAGNPNTAATSKTVTVSVDTESPGVSIGVPSGVQNSAFSVTITFTEAVSGFVSSDVSLSGSAASITGWRSNSSNTVYTATITPTASGTVTVSVAANVAIDAAGNPNTAATSKTVIVSVDTESPGVSISVPSGVQNGAFNVTITFTEVVSGFTQSDLSLSGTATASITAWNTTDNTTYIATITPTTSGSVTLGVAANVATDTANNPNTAATSRTVTIDIDKPLVTIGVPSGTQTGAFDATITFSETVLGFVDSDVSLSGLAASITGWRSNSSNTVYTATITPMASGTVTVNVAANVATDAAGNNNTAATSKTVTVSVDTDPPGVSISVPSGVQTGAFDATITFTESVSGFTQSDLSLSGTATASITGWTSNNTTYTATITPTTSGTITLNVNANVATDAAGNPNTAATSRTVTVDIDKPLVTIGVPSGTQTGAFDATITFSETVLGFVDSDVSLSGNAASITGWRSNSNNTVYTATITPTASGTVTVSVAANVATDAAGNPNTAAASKTVTVSVDTDAPGVSISVPSEVRNGAFSVTITFTEPVSGFVGSDVSLTGSAASVTSWSANSGNTVYTATITPTASGTVTITVAANVATDAANNPNTAATPKTVTVDIDRPTVTIDVPSGTQTGAFDTTITFSETVSGFTQSDVSLTGSAASITDWRANSGNTVYTATITPTASGTVTVSVSANVATDSANNPNTAATSKTVTVSVDTDAPGVSISVPSGVQNGAFSATIKFTESVSGFTQSDLSLTGTASITAWNATDNTTYAATITPTTSGTITLNINAGVATDAANNPNTAATPKTVTVDIDRPTVTIGVPSGTQTGAFDATITFSETVSGFTQSEVSLTGIAASITAWSANSDKTVFTATITPTASGTVAISGAANVATDAANNPNTAATSQTVTIALPEVTPDPVTSWMPDANLRAVVRKELGLTDNETLTQAKMLDVGILEAPNSQIADLTGLEYATKLKYLILDRNKISDLTPLQNLTELEELKLGRNKVSDVTPLGGLTALRILRLTSNSVTDATPLGNLVNLEWLRLKGNKNITNLHVLAGLPKLNNYDITIPNPPIGPHAAPTQDEEAPPPLQTLLLPNYPNPFNPETWIPYHLANDSDVQITIYDTRGTVVRRLDLGHQREGYYTSRSRAAYWDGRNEFGERVATGIYFYQLQADNMSLLRKMVILK